MRKVCTCTSICIYAYFVCAGKFPFAELRIEPVLGPLVFIAYIVFVFFITVNFFVAIITDAYSTAKDAMLAAEEDAAKNGTLEQLDIFYFLLEKVRKVLRLRSMRSIGQTIEEETSRFDYIGGELSCFLHSYIHTLASLLSPPFPTLHHLTFYCIFNWLHIAIP